MTRGAPKADNYNGPKKPASGSYFMWCNDNRAAVMDAERKASEAEGRKFEITKVGATLAQRYKVECTEEQKKAYQAKSEILKKEYNEKFAAWKLTEQYAEFEKAKKAFDKKNSGKKDKAELKAAGQPSKPLSGYFLFINEKRAEITEVLKKEHGDAFKIGMVAGRGAEMWKKLTADDKIPYDKKAAAAKEQYAQDLAAFKETDGFKAIEAAKVKTAKPKRTRKPKGETPADGATATEPAEGEDEE